MAEENLRAFRRYKKKLRGVPPYAWKKKNRADLIQDIDSIISKHIRDHINEWSKDKILYVFWVVWRILRL